MKLRTVARCYRWDQAHLALAWLRASGLEAHLAHQHIHHLKSYMSVGFQGIEITVPASQAAEAHELLDAFDDTGPRPSGWFILVAIFFFWLCSVPMGIPSGLYRTERPKVMAEASTSAR